MQLHLLGWLDRARGSSSGRGPYHAQQHRPNHMSGPTPAPPSYAHFNVRSQYPPRPGGQPYMQAGHHPGLLSQVQLSSMVCTAHCSSVYSSYQSFTAHIKVCTAHVKVCRAHIKLCTVETTTSEHHSDESHVDAVLMGMATCQHQNCSMKNASTMQDSGKMPLALLV